MVLVTGSRGLLGSALCQYLTLQGREVEGWDLPENDLTDVKEVVARVEGMRPEVIFHLAAWTDVDRCELDRERAYRVNILGTWGIALAAARIHAPVLYMSTDYVFDGEKGEPYLEYDDPRPINYYGWTKLVGEQIVSRMLEKGFIVRTCGLYGPGGKNFVAAVMEQAREGRQLRVVNDQWVSPTYVADLVPLLVELAFSKYYGFYHLANQGCIAWYEFARAIVEISGLSCEVCPVTTEELGWLARRPRVSALKNGNFQLIFGHQPRGWREALGDYLKGACQGQPGPLGQRAQARWLSRD